MIVHWHFWLFAWGFCCCSLKRSGFSVVVLSWAHLVRIPSGLVLHVRAGSQLTQCLCLTFRVAAHLCLSRSRTYRGLVVWVGLVFRDGVVCGSSGTLVVSDVFEFPRVLPRMLVRILPGGPPGFTVSLFLGHMGLLGHVVVFFVGPRSPDTLCLHPRPRLALCSGQPQPRRRAPWTRRCLSVALCFPGGRHPCLGRISSAWWHVLGGGTVYRVVRPLVRRELFVSCVLGLVFRICSTWSF